MAILRLFRTPRASAQAAGDIGAGETCCIVLPPRVGRGRQYAALRDSIVPPNAPRRFDSVARLPSGWSVPCYPCQLVFIGTADCKMCLLASQPPLLRLCKLCPLPGYGLQLFRLPT